MPQLAPWGVVVYATAMHADCVAVVGEEGFAVACLVSTRLWFKVRRARSDGSVAHFSVLTPLCQEPGCKLPRDTQWQHAQAFDRCVWLRLC